jgi:protein O-mannosyl-transferase
MSAGTVGTKTTIAKAWIADANPGERTGSSRRSGHRAQLVWIGLLILAAALPYLPTLGYSFVYDDMPQIVHNPDLVSLHNIPRFFTQFISKALGFHNTAQPVFYRPLFFSQLCLTRVLFGPGPFGFHLVSLLLHIGNTLLLYVLALRLGLRTEAAKLAGLIFAVHPVHVEPVVWPSASPDLMVLGATLAALLAFLRTQESARSGAARYGWWGVSLLAFSAGLFVKETSLIILPLLIGVILCESARTFDLRRHGLDMAPYLGITLFYFLVRRHVLHGLVPTVTPTSLLNMARTWPSVLWFYERHLILPVHASILYDYDLVESATVGAFWLPLGAVVASCASAAFFLWKRRSTAVLVAVLLLISPIVLVLNFRVFYWRDLVHDRYLYTPSAGFCILAAIVLVQAGAWASKAISPVVQQFLAAGLLCALALTTLAEAQPWRNNLSVLANAAKVAPRNIGAQILLGEELEGRSNFVEAKICDLRALQLTPAWGPAWFAYGRTLLLTGDPEGAIQSFQRAVVLDGSPIERVWLALAMDQVGRHDESRALLARAVAQDPAMIQAAIEVERKCRKESDRLRGEAR